MSIIAKALLGIYRSAIQVIADPFYNYVSLRLNGEGANNASNNTLIDSSPNAFTLTRVGTPSQGSFSPFSNTGWSGLFNATGYVSSTVAAIGSGDFTLEFWTYRTVDTNQYIFTLGTAPNWGETNGISLLNYQGFYALTVGSANSNNMFPNPPLNTWNHIVITRQGSTVKMYLNGVASGVTLTTSSNISGTALRIGNGAAGSWPNYTGYMSNFRIVNGSSVYTANFTPPTAQLTAIAGTILLTLQSNRFIDRSASNIAVVPVTKVDIAPISPFLPANGYSPVTHGGSIHFNGTDQRVTIPYNALFNAGLGAAVTPFTIEAWFYCTSLTAGQQGIVERYKSSGSGWSLTLQSTGRIRVTMQGNAAVIDGTTVLMPNAWNHIALSGSLNSWKLFLNGVQEGPTHTAYVDTGQDAGIVIGALAGNANFFRGYITGVRYTSSALYTANFIPSAEPVVVNANTQLLVNGSGGGIVDLSSKNNVTTISGAQVSTIQAKFGTSSLFFNGTTDYLRIPNTPAVDTSTGDFTIEFWLYKVANNPNTSRLWNPDGDAFDSITLALNASGTLHCAATTATGAWNVINTTWGVTPVNNQWYHIALVRSGANIFGFVDGVRTILTTTCPVTLYNAVTANKVIGGQSGASRMLNGYIDDFRLTKGIARYTANFTPPALPHPVQ